MPTDADVLLTGDPAALRGRTVMISGATGAVGRALVARLLGLGAHVAIAVRKPWQVERLQRELPHAATLVGVVGARDGEAAAGFVKGATDSLGPIVAFVSTAGTFRMAEIGKDPGSDDLALLEANFLAAHTLVRAVVGPMKRRKSGAVVLTGARAVGTAGAGMALYCASKAALHEYARCLAAEVAPAGIRVAVVAPGVLDTAANREAMPDTDPAGWTPVEQLVDALVGAAAGGAPVGAIDPVYPLTSR